MATRVGKERGTVPARAQPGNFPGSNSQTSNPLISDAKLKQLLATMLQCRILGQRSRRLRGRNKSREGYELPPVQEAVAVGAAIDLRRQDWIAPGRGDVVASFIKGAALNAIFSQFNAGASPKNGSDKGRSAAAREGHPGFRVLPASATAEAQLSVAAGVALTMREQKNGNI